MTLFLLMKPSNALDRHVVRFRCARSENDVFWVRTNEIGNVLFVKKQKNRYAQIWCHEDIIDAPFWPPQQLFQPPSRRRESDCVGFRIGPLSKGASRQALGGPRVSLPE